MESIKYVIHDLEKYLEACDDEWSETMESLIYLHSKCVMSEALKAAIEDELRRNLEWISEKYEVVEKTRELISTYKKLERRIE